MSSRLTPQSPRQSCRVKQGMDPFNYGPVTSFSYSIVLRRVVYGEFLLRAFGI